MPLGLMQVLSPTNAPHWHRAISLAFLLSSTATGSQQHTAACALDLVHTVCKWNSGTTTLLAPVCVACTSPCCNGGTEACDGATEPQSLWPAKLHYLALYGRASPRTQAGIHMLSPLLCLQCPCTLLAVTQVFIEWTITPSQIYLLKLKREIKLCAIETQDSSFNGLALGCFQCPRLEEQFQVEMWRWSDNPICPVRIPVQVRSQQSLKTLMDADVFMTQNKEGGWEEAHRPSVVHLKLCLV